MPLAIALVLMLVLAGISMVPCFLPSLFLVPPLAGGFILAYVRAARGEPFSFGTLFEGFSEGRYWSCMGAFWLLFVILNVLAVPTESLLYLGLFAGLAAIAEWGPVGLIVLAVLIPLAFSPAIYGVSRVIWVLPLVVDRRLRAMEAFEVSWHLTGRILKGFGMFVVLTVLLMILLSPVTLVAGTLTAALAGASAAVGQASDGPTVQTPAASSNVPQSSQAAQDFAKGTSRERTARSLEAQAQMADLIVALTFFATLAVAAVGSVVSILLWMTLWMPVFVAYRDMTAPVEAPSGHPSPSTGIQNFAGPQT